MKNGKKSLGVKVQDSIGDVVPYQQAVIALVEAHETWDTSHEGSTQDKLGQAAASASWDALTATIDTYVARKISDTLARL